MNSCLTNRSLLNVESEESFLKRGRGGPTRSVDSFQPYLCCIVGIGHKQNYFFAVVESFINTSF